MNYKKILSSRTLRIKILSLLNFVPDKQMISFQYQVHTGRKICWRKCKRFTEKIQVYKLRRDFPIMQQCTDKHEVREYIRSKGLDNQLIPIIGVYDSADEISFEKLPNQFVAKTTDGGGGNQVFICRNKGDITKEDFLSKLNDWMKAPKPRTHFGREWAYENGYPRRIIIEELLTDGNKKDIPDYKFWCFNGKPVYCQVIGSRSENETIDFFDMDWNHQSFTGINPFKGSYKAFDNATTPIPCPEKFDDMKEIAKKLSKDFPFVRVDLYQANGKVYFGELTFYPASGYGHFTPDEWDEKIGNLFAI